MNLLAVLIVGLAAGASGSEQLRKDDYIGAASDLPVLFDMAPPHKMTKQEAARALYLARLSIHEIVSWCGTNAPTSSGQVSSAEHDWLLLHRDLLEKADAVILGDYGEPNPAGLERFGRLGTDPGAQRLSRRPKEEQIAWCTVEAPSRIASDRFKQIGRAHV